MFLSFLCQDWMSTACWNMKPSSSRLRLSSSWKTSCFGTTSVIRLCTHLNCPIQISHRRHKMTCNIFTDCSETNVFFMCLLCSKMSSINNANVKKQQCKVLLKVSKRHVYSKRLKIDSWICTERDRWPDRFWPPSGGPSASSLLAQCRCSARKLSEVWAATHNKTRLNLLHC